jgi:diacylglycerol kinase family enzyme
LSLDKAVVAFATGEILAVDMASANGRPFVHQFSVGMHAKMVDLRSKMEFGSRWGKIRASAKAAYSTLMNPPSMRVALNLGDADVLIRTTGIGFTNNLFGEGTLPYANDPAGGRLGIYVTMASQRGELIRFFAKMARGKWRDNQHVEIHETDAAVLVIKSRRFRRKAVIDGELVELQRRTAFEIHPKVLNVLVPAATAQKQPRKKKSRIVDA